MTKTIAASLLAMTFAGPALSQGTHSHGDHKMPADKGATHDADMMKMINEMKPAPGDAVSTKAFKEADMKMMHDMHVPYTGNADVDFRTHMIPHHKGAVEMSKVALKHAKDPATKAMAEKIIADQEKEIAEMEAWLKKNRK
nr:DUF305 domain-containing protein [Methylobacterium iners]